MNHSKLLVSNVIEHRRKNQIYLLVNQLFPDRAADGFKDFKSLRSFTFDDDVGSKEENQQ